MKKILGLGVILIALSTASNAQTPVPATASASATIIAPITLTKDVDLQFGSLAAGAAAGTVTIDASVTPNRTGTNVTLSTIGAAPTAARYTVTGTAGYTYLIGFPSRSVTIINGSNNMLVDNLVSSKVSDIGTLTGGTDIFYVGGRLNVAIAQIPGTYTGTFTVNVNYN